jgi:diacylglycerol kinase
VANFDGGQSGPPGVGLDVSGAGYLDCDRVYFFFDGVRIGSDTPDASGAVGAGRLAVPGDAKVGEHRVTSSCMPSGDVVRASRTFLVTEATFHRSGIATSLAHPDQVSLELERLATSAIVAVALLLLFAFPFELFNSTVEENYDEIRGYFHLPPRLAGEGTRLGRIVSFFGLTAVAAVTVGFLSPDFGPNLNSVVIALGFMVALLIMSVGFSLPADIGVHRRTGEWGKLNFLPGTVLVSILMVALSRVLDFQPGYFYGALAGLAFASALSKVDQGRLTAANWVWALILSVGAWFLRIPVSEAAAQPDASVWWIGVEACLVLVFLWGIEGLVVAMLPMRFLDGRKVIDWNRVVWSILMFLGVFAAVHVLLSPTSGYVGHTTGEVTVGVVVLFLIFGAISVGIWAYFRYRPERWIPKRAR